MLNSDENASKQNESLNESEQKDSNRRNNAGGYSWWKWRRSTDSQEKKSPSKEITEDNKDERQSVERTVEEIKDNNLSDSMNVISNVDMLKEEQALDAMNQSTHEIQNNNLSVDNIDSMDDSHKNDDSISSELADVSKTSFSAEKYRKTLRLTSEQIVSK